MFMYINQIIVEEELYNDEDNDRMGKNHKILLNSSTLSQKNILLQMNLIQISMMPNV